MAYIVMACIAMAYIVVAYIVMACIVMVYIVMAYIVVAHIRQNHNTEYVAVTQMMRSCVGHGCPGHNYIDGYLAMTRVTPR